MKILWLPQISSWFLSTLSLLQKFVLDFYPKALFSQKGKFTRQNVVGADTNKSVVQIAKIIIMIMIMMIVLIKTFLMCQMPELDKCKLIVDTY